MSTRKITITIGRRKARFYSLFIRAKGSRRWHRVSPRHYTKDKALHMYYAALVGYFYQGIDARLRPVTGPACLTADQIRLINVRVRLSHYAPTVEA